MEERFLKYVNKTESCWLWTGGTVKGYGRISINNKRCLAHRVAYELWKGSIPVRLLIRHMCHNPLCVNPEHLETGTHQDNTNDMIQANRQIHTKGEDQPTSKLTNAEVVKIREYLNEGKLTQRQLGKLFNVAHCTIGIIKRGEGWKHI